MFGALPGGYRVLLDALAAGAGAEVRLPPPSSAWNVARTVGGSLLGRSTSTPSCSPSRRRRWPGCWRPSRRSRRRPPPGSSSRPRSSSRWRTGPRMPPPCPGRPGPSWRPTNRSRSRASRTPRASGRTSRRRRRTVRLRASLGRFGDAATCRPRTPSSRAGCAPTSRCFPGSPASRSPCTCSGEAGSRSTRSATSTGPGRSRTGSRPGSRSRARRCTGSACRRASGPPARRPGAWPRRSPCCLVHPDSTRA